MDRREGAAKLTGAECYVDDIPVAGCLWGMTVRSPVPRGRIRSIRFGDGLDWSAFTIVDHRDIPGPNVIYLIEHDQPVLASDEVRHVHEPVLLVAHESREMVRRAVRAIEVIVDPMPALLDYRRTPSPEQVQHGDDNVLKRLRIEKGDVAGALAAATHVVEGVYETGAQEHVYIETQGMLAWEEDGVLLVKGSMQCPYYVLNALVHALGRDASEVGVIQAATGGGFGGKEDFPSNLAVHAALLALKAGRPVRMIYDRSEDMAATTKRHPARIRHRTGLDADGKLVAREIDVLLDGGAYVTLSPVVLSRAIIHAAGPYACDHVRIDGRAVLSNTVPFGAFRGFGAPQTQFAGERHMDVIAKTLGLDPIELRRRNLIRDGQSTSTGQVIDDGADRVAIMDRALELAAYRKKQQEHASFNASHPFLRRGIGSSTFYHGAGFTGAGEVALASRLEVEGLPDGRVRVLSANTEMGQGTTTIFTQIVAERLGLAPGDVEIAEPDTRTVPNSGPTVASRTAMVVGRLLEQACDGLRLQVGVTEEARGDDVTHAIRAWHETSLETSLETSPRSQLIAEAVYRKPPGIDWDDHSYRGEAYGAFAWGTNVVEVEVDLRSFNVRVLDVVAVQEIGRVLNDTLARGQIQGGVVQAIGWALMEDCRWRNGEMANHQLTDYIIPTSADVPPIRVEFLESPYEHGARGAKGIGELPIDGPAPAIANAIADALDCDPRSIPMLPERLMEMVPHAAD